MALTLIKPEYDQWGPGEHNGTFRGNNLAFVAATEALSFWKDDSFSISVREKGEKVRATLEVLVEKYPELQGEVRGRGLMQGIACGPEGLASKICRDAFEFGLIIETSGPEDEVVKLLPPLTIDEEGLTLGLSILEKSIQHVLHH